jgi:hypothetical protein
MANVIAKEEVLLVLGSSGSDGGYRLLTPHGIVKVPSNNPEARVALEALTQSYEKLQSIAVKEQAGQSTR